MSMNLPQKKEFGYLSNDQQVLWLIQSDNKYQVKNQNGNTCSTEDNVFSQTKITFYIDDQQRERQLSIEEERQENKNTIFTTEVEQLIGDEQNNPQKSSLNQQNNKRHLQTFIFNTIFSNPLNPFPYPNLPYLNNGGIITWFSQNFFQFKTQKTINYQSETHLNFLTPIPEKSKKSLSSIDTHHVVKNFIQFFWTKLQEQSSLILLQSIIKSKKSQEKFKENDSLIQQQEELQKQDVTANDYIQATKELLSELTQQKGNKNKSYSWSILHQLTTIKSYQRRIFNQVIISRLKLITINTNMSSTQKHQHKWVYKNSQYYEVTRRIMLWFLRGNQYTVHIMKSPLMKHKARNLKYVKRWIYELKYPDRCNKLYVADENQYFQKENNKIQKVKRKLPKNYQIENPQKSKKN